MIWLASLKEPNSKLIRWKIKLNEYEFDVSHVQGKENKVADALSRIRETNYYSKCHICGKENKDKIREYQHNQVHKGQTKCKFCHKVFATTSALYQHYRKIHEHKGSKVPIEPIEDEDYQTVHSADEDDIDLFKITENHFRVLRIR